LVGTTVEGQGRGHCVEQGNKKEFKDGQWERREIILLVIQPW